MRYFGEVVEDNAQWVKLMTCALHGHQWIPGNTFWGVLEECTYCGTRIMGRD